MAGPKINVNRYRLITLLYVVFVCLSVLNIPVSLLDSNIHLIKTLEYQERNRLEEVKFADKVIQSQDSSLFKDTAKVYFEIQKAIHSCYLTIDSVDQIIKQKFSAIGTSVEQEFNSKRKIESFLVKDSLLERMKSSLFGLISLLDNKPFQLDTAIKSLTPIATIVKNHSGKEIDWETYLFLHKPTAISYMQIKRIKVLLLDNEYLYQNAALRTINLIPAFYSIKDNQVFAFPQDKASASQIINNKTSEANNSRDSIFKKSMDSLQKIKNDLSDSIRKIDQSRLEQKSKDYIEKNRFDDITQKIVKAFRTENYYLGIPNLFLTNFPFQLGKDILLEVTPAANIIKSNDDYKIIFLTQGKHSVKFFDLRDGKQIEIINLTIDVSLLPPPQVKLAGDNNLRDLISIKDLFIANRLSGILVLPNLDYFPGRITGFRMTRITTQKEQQSVYNYGEVFQNQIHGLIKNLEKGDLILFDRITLSMQDGTTRTTNSIVFKIDE